MKDINLKIHFRNMRKWLGLCYAGREYIELNAKQCQSEMLSTLIHELVHFLLASIIEGKLTNDKSNVAAKIKVIKIRNFAKPVSKKQAKINEKLEEDLCDAIAAYASKKIHKFMVGHKM